jgi:hypothetical protein
VAREARAGKGRRGGEGKQRGVKVQVHRHHLTPPLPPAHKYTCYPSQEQVPPPLLLPAALGVGLMYLPLALQAKQLVRFKCPASCGMYLRRCV